MRWRPVFAVLMVLLSLSTPALAQYEEEAQTSDSVDVSVDRPLKNEIRMATRDIPVVGDVVDGTIDMIEGYVEWLHE